MKRIFSKLLRFTSYLIAVTVGLLLLVSIVLVSYVGPRLEQWREPIQTMVQKHTGMPIEFGGLSLGWDGIKPRLVLSDIYFREPEKNHATLALPAASVEEVRLSVEPRLSFWKGDLLSVSLINSHLPVFIDSAGDVWIGQHRLPMAQVSFSKLPETAYEQSDPESATFIAALSNYLTRDFSEQINLLQQDKLFHWIKRASVENLKLSVSDASTDNSTFDFELLFKEATVTVDDKRIKSELLLQADQVSAHDIVIDNLIDYSGFEADKNRAVSGYLNLHAREMVPGQLFPLTLEHYRIEQVVVRQFDLKAQLNHGFWERFEAFLQLTDFSMPQAQAERVDLSLNGDVADVLAVFTVYGHQHAPIHFQAFLENVRLHETNHFRHDFNLAQLSINGSYELDDAALPVLSVQELLVDDPNVRIKAQGSWHAVPERVSGHLQLSGEIQHLEASYLPRFLPKVIEKDALDWLDGAFLNGTLEHGYFEIDGLADHYPYGCHPQSGVNRIIARFKEMALDFHHQAKADKWPVLHMEQGTFQFLNDDIIVDANRGWMNNKAGEKSVVYDNLHANINSLEQDTNLQISAVAESSAEQFLGLMKETPLSALLNHVLDESEANGELRASLDIGIPLNDMDSSTIKGTLYAQDGRFRLNSAFPMATAINGSLSFNERYLTVENVNAQLLGGPVQLHGDIGRAGHAFSMNGKLSGEGIYAYYPLQGLRQLKGLTPYEFKLQFLENDAFDATLQSNLVGLSINYPGLYIKAAQQQAPLSIQWQRRRAQDGNQLIDRISAQYDKKAVQLNSEFLSHKNNQSLAFRRGAVAFSETPVLPERGLHFHGQIDKIEVTSLTDWIERFGFADSGDAAPIVSGFDIGTKELLIGGFNLADVRIRSELQSFKNLPLQLSGPTIEGQLRLQESNTAKGLYDVNADLKHFYWRLNEPVGALQTKKASADGKAVIKSAAESPWKLNSLNLKVNNLAFYKYHVANLEAQGEAEDKHNWRLDKLSVREDKVHLFGAAYLRQAQDKLNADLNFNINVLNTGTLLDALALGEDLLTGHGDIQGSLQVRDVLNFESDQLELNVLGVLRDGHINNVGNGATRILSLLSLQALSKLPELHKIFSSEGENAINYSYLRFHLGLKNNLLWLPDLRLDSPLLAIVAQGQGNLKTEAIDLDVVAVPHLDISGAAVLTGVLVNPAVGVAAFLSQWLLRSPLERGLTQRFKVSGTLDDIHIDGVPIEKLKSSEPNPKVVESDSRIAPPAPPAKEDSGDIEQQAGELKVIELHTKPVELVPDKAQNQAAPIILE
ncbi:hypothetical protein AAEX37_01449 [Oligella sp. MSHR50489EDL]